MVSFPFGEERGEGADFVQVDKELLVTSFITSDNLQKKLNAVIMGGGGGRMTCTMHPWSQELT